METAHPRRQYQALLPCLRFRACYAPSAFRWSSSASLELAKLAKDWIAFSDLCVPPAPGIVPKVISGKPKRASAEAKIMSHCMSKSAGVQRLENPSKAVVALITGVCDSAIVEVQSHHQTADLLACLAIIKSESSLRRILLLPPVLAFGSSRRRRSNPSAIRHGACAKSAHLSHAISAERILRFRRCQCCQLVEIRPG
jgi:hypothetical protein